MTGPALPRVLLVDDHAELRGALRRRLGTQFDLVEAASCEEAVRLLNLDADFAAMLLDVRFGPGELRGDEALPAFRARWPLLPIIVFTVEDEIDTAVACLEAGAAAFVTKDRAGFARLPAKLTHAIAVGLALRRDVHGLAAAALVHPTEPGPATAAPGAAPHAEAGPAAARPVPEAIQPLAEVVRTHCLAAVQACGGSIRKAASYLGIPYSSFRRKVAKWRRAAPSD